MHRMVTNVATILAFVVACDPEDGPGGGPQVVTDTLGDTVVVRTLSGSVWGDDAGLVPELSIGEALDGPEEHLFGSIASLAVDDDGNIYVLDRQAQELRVFDAKGEYLETLARRGRGPGELEGAGKIALLPDGRVVVRDPRNKRVQVVRPGTGEREEWPYEAAAHLTLSPLWTDAFGRTYLVAPDLATERWGDEVVIVLGPDGTGLDTVPTPDAEFAQPLLEASRVEGRIRSWTTRPVPFSPSMSWAVHRSGGFLSGVSTDYRIELRLGKRVLRIERVYDPLPVSPAERDYEREFIEVNLRDFQPDWEWDGPPIPETKPPFKGIHSGRDGRIWVELSAEPHSASEVWRGERIRYDVFESDGTYLGAVNAPEDFSTHPAPVFGTDHVWAVTRDDLRVERVVRYRIRVGTTN